MVSFSPIDIAITSTYKDKGARQAQNSLTKLSKSANKLAGAFGVAFGVNQVTKFAKHPFKPLPKSKNQPSH